MLLLLALLTNLTLAPLDSRLCVIPFFPPPPPHFKEDDGAGGPHPELEEGAEVSGGDDAARVIGMGIGGLAGIWNVRMSTLF